MSTRESESSALSWRNSNLDGVGGKLARAKVKCALEATRTWFNQLSSAQFRMKFGLAVQLLSLCGRGFRLEVDTAIQELHSFVPATGVRSLSLSTAD